MFEPIVKIFLKINVKINSRKQKINMYKFAILKELQENSAIGEKPYNAYIKHMP